MASRDRTSESRDPSQRGESGRGTTGNIPARRADQVIGWPSVFRSAFPVELDMLGRLGEEMEQLLSVLGTGRMGGGQRALTTDGQGRTTWIPQIEVRQEQNQLVVRADLPGMDPDSVDVSVQGNVLRISGERKQETQEERGGIVRSEIMYGTFSRSLALPDGADVDNLSANFNNGVLEIRVPMREQSRRIPVSSESGRSTESGQSGRQSGH